jgi:hypothetical protein
MSSFVVLGAATALVVLCLTGRPEIARMTR